MQPENIIFTKSNNKNKKYKVNFDLNNKNHTLHFGDLRYKHFYDSTPNKIYSHLNYNDKHRQHCYLKQAIEIKDKQNKYTYTNPLSSNFFLMERG